MTQALSMEQIRTMQSGVRYFNVEENAAASCGTATNLAGSENAEKIFNFFISKGLQPFQAAGLMGNMQAESGLNPKRVQGTPTPAGDQDNITVDGHTGYGLVQWTSRGRQQGLADLAANNNTISGDLGTQLQYIMQELEGPYKSDYDKLLASTNITDATNIILMGYERPKNPDASRATRLGFAQDILARYGSGTASATTTSDSVTTCATGSSGEVIGSFSLPVDRHWYDEHPDWFTKPHHDYPAADIPVPSGTSVYSMTAGKVLKAPVGSDCGIGVLIDAGNGVQFVYCHGSDGGSVVSAKVGDEVKPGQLIMHSELMC